VEDIVDLVAGRQVDELLGKLRFAARGVATRSVMKIIGKACAHVPGYPEMHLDRGRTVSEDLRPAATGMPLEIDQDVECHPWAMRLRRGAKAEHGYVDEGVASGDDAGRRYSLSSTGP